MKLPIMSTGSGAQLISSEEYDKELKAFANTHGFETYGEYWKWKLKTDLEASEKRGVMYCDFTYDKK